MDIWIIIKTIMAFFGSLAFGIIFNMKPRHLLAAAAGGMLDWIIYYILHVIMGGIFFPTLCASFFAVLYGELLARIRHCPANLYVITSLIPLIPGGSLYYMMSNAVQKQWTTSKAYGVELIMYAFGLAAGICLMSALLELIRQLVSRSMKRLKSRNTQI